MKHSTTVVHASRRQCSSSRLRTKPGRYIVGTKTLLQQTNVGGITKGPFTIDHDAARRKLEQLRSITDLSIVNIAEPYRISGLSMFKYNLIDPMHHMSVVVIYILCKLISSNCWSFSFIALFVIIFVVVDQHFESYRTFKKTRSIVQVITKDPVLRENFLLSYFGVRETANLNTQMSTILVGAKNDHREDSFDWINKLILFFWPYLSQTIHRELDEFFNEQIRLGRMSRSRKRMVRFLHTILTQFNSRILAIEKFQLGHQTPIVKQLNIREIQNSQKSTPVKDSEKSLVCDINVVYNGDMNLTLLCRNFCCLSSRIGLKDIFLNFKFRFILGPISSRIPFVKTLSITLLELPDFGYKGIALVELAQLRIARRLINQLLKEHLLFPHSITIHVKDFLQERGHVKSKKRVPEPVMEQQENIPKDSSCFSKLLANTILQGCLCSNYCLRICQKHGNDRISSTNSHNT